MMFQTLPLLFGVAKQQYFSCIVDRFLLLLLYKHTVRVTLHPVVIMLPSVNASYKVL